MTSTGGGFGAATGLTAGGGGAEGGGGAALAGSGLASTCSLGLSTVTGLPKRFCGERGRLSPHYSTAQWWCESLIHALDTRQLGLGAG